MNINPSDTDVRQGYSPAESVTAKQSTTTIQRSQTQTSVAASDPVDAHSQAVASAADRTLALEVAKKLGDQLAAGDTGLKIRVLDDSKSSVQVEIVNQQNNKVLRKIPQDDLLKLAATIKEMTGVLVNHPA